MGQVLVQCPVFPQEYHAPLCLGWHPWPGCLLQHTAHPKYYIQNHFLTLVFLNVHGLLTVASCYGKVKVRRSPLGLLFRCPRPYLFFLSQHFSPLTSLQISLSQRCWPQSAPLPAASFCKSSPQPFFPLSTVVSPCLKTQLRELSPWGLAANRHSCWWELGLLCLPVSLSKTDGRCKPQ